MDLFFDLSVVLRQNSLFLVHLQTTKDLGTEYGTSQPHVEAYDAATVELKLVHIEPALVLREVHPVLRDVHLVLASKLIFTGSRGKHVAHDKHITATILQYEYQEMT